MENIDTYFTELITRYLHGEASQAEIQELEKWVAEKPEHAEIFKSVHATWKAVAALQINDAIDINEEWQRLQSRLPVPEPIVVKPPTRFQAMLPFLRMAAVFLLLLLPAFIFYRYYSVAEDTIVTADHGMLEHVLPDGSVVTLNNGSSVSYADAFNETARVVHLEGQAYFMVTHNPERPFRIEAGKLRVEVLGTSFEARTDSKGEMKQVILDEGKVKIWFDGWPGSDVYLSPGEKAIVAGDHHLIKKSTNNDPNYLAWKSRRMVFTDTPLNEVARVLMAVYHVDIILAGSGTVDCKITATFDNQSLEAVLNVIAATLDVTINKTSRGIEISGDGCR